MNNSSDKGLHDGHRERLRSKLSQMDDDDILTHEMLEAMLFYAQPRVNTNPIAHRLIQTFGSVEGVMSADFEELKNVRGVGKRTAEFLQLLGKFTRTYARSRYRSVVYKFGDESTTRYLRGLFTDINYEMVFILCLAPNHGIIKECCVIEGGFETVELDVGTIAQLALRYSSKDIVCVHNHPSGIAKASQGDREAIAVLGTALKIVGVNLYDSVIVSDKEIYSMTSDKTVKIEQCE